MSTQPPLPTLRADRDRERESESERIRTGWLGT